MKNNTCGISVIIPVYNASSFLEEAVSSALNCPEVAEIILIEDGSKDGSLHECFRLQELHDAVNVLTHPNNENRGAGASRNLGIQHAKEALVAFLDADDYYLPGRFEQAIAILKSNAEADGVYEAIGSDFENVEQRVRYLATGLPELTTVHFSSIEPNQLLYHLIGVEKNCGYFSLDGLIIRRQALQKMNTLFNEDLRVHQDTEFILRLSWYCKLHPGSIENPVSIRRVHPNNRITSALSNNKKSAKNKLLFYSALLNWAHSAKLPKRVVDYIDNQATAYSIASVGSMRAWFSVIMIWIKSRSAFDNHNSRYIIFKSLQDRGVLSVLFAKALEKFVVKE